MMSFQNKYSEIQKFLSVPADKFDIEQIVNENFESDDLKLNILGKILGFIYYFSPFKDNRAFMNSVYLCVKKTLEIKLVTIEDFEELLIKNSLMRFIQEYIDYAKIGQKEQVLNFLADSFERLGLQPLILNLGILLKPMYTDQSYINKVTQLEEVEVSYIIDDGVGIEIKKAIDMWLESQTIDLDKQEEMKEKLKEEFDRLVEHHNVPKDSKTYQTLLIDVIEMLSMKLTMLSLMDTLADDSFEPIPIR